MSHTTAKVRPAAIIVGRFQVHELHIGHQHLIIGATSHAECASFNKDVLIVIGVSQARANKRDPLPFEARRGMVSSFFNINEDRVVPLQDRGNIRLWSHDLDKLIRQHFGDRPAIIYGSRDSIVDTYVGAYPTHRINTVNLSPTGSDLREQLRDTAYVNLHLARDPGFRAGYIASIMQRKDIDYGTVDMALMTQNRSHVVLGHKEHDGEKWCFPGGYFSRTEGDHSYEDAAKRELLEECGKKLVLSKPTSIGTCPIDDWRYRDTGDAIMTHFYLFDLLDGALEAGDDLDGIREFPLAALPEVIVPEHQVLVRMLLDLLG